MRIWIVVALVACDAGTREPAHPTNLAPPAPAVSAQQLVQRAIVASQGGGTHLVWIQAGRERGIDTDDPCCGVSYDGNRYDDALATCSVKDDECPAGRTAVYPGLADDAVCGERRRCVPLPLARVVVTDGSRVEALDADEQPLAMGTSDAIAHRPVVVGREGLITLTIDGTRTERVALDYGARYTIVVDKRRVDRITVD